MNGLVFEGCYINKLALLIPMHPVHLDDRGHSLSCTKLLSPHSAGEGEEEEKPEWRLAMINREIVRRGALILFCDYVVRPLDPVFNRSTYKLDEKLCSCV